MELIDLFNIKNTKAVVIETYGTGNAPSSVILQALISSYISNGGLVLNVTQCSSGSVKHGAYQTSAFFQNVGVISANDLTTEAALTKLQYLFGQNLSVDEVKIQLNSSLVGEMGN